MLKHIAILSIAAALLCSASKSFAEAPAEDAWRFNITPYLWLPSVNTSQSVTNDPVNVESSTEGYDILDRLDFALLGTMEVAKGKWGVILDFQTVKTSNDNTVQLLGNTHHFTTDLTVADATLALEYRVIEAPKYTLDVLGGARAVYGYTGIDIDATGAGPGFNGSASKTWIDPIVGLKAHYFFNDHWSVGAYGDIGGFIGESVLTYQLIGMVQYHFNKHFAVDLGYRYWFDKFEKGDFKLDASLYGPVLGLTFSF